VGMKNGVYDLNCQTNERLIDPDPWISDDVARVDANWKRRGEKKRGEKSSP